MDTYDPKSARQLRRMKKLTLIVGGRKTTFNIAEEVSLTDAPLDEIFIRHAEQVARFGYLWATARAQLRKAQAVLDETKGRAYIAMREKLEEEGERYISDQYVNSLLDCHEVLDSARKEVHQFQTTLDMLSVVRNALEHRRSALISLSAENRGEARPTVRKRRGKHGQED